MSTDRTPTVRARTMEEFRAGFLEEPGYLDFARIGPLSQTVLDEAHAQNARLSRARFGTLDGLADEDERLRTALAALIGFRVDQIVFQPNTSTGLMHALFGLTGGVLLSAGEFPSLTYSAVRASEALHVVQPVWLETDHGRVTPGQIREQVTAGTAAVAVSLVDSRTGYLADIDGIRQVIGDRLLIVDAIQGFGVVDAPYSVADVVVSGGQKWARAGWGTGFMAMSDRALERILPVFSGFAGASDPDAWDAVGEPARGARAYSVSNPDSVAEARLAAAVEEVNAVGVGAIAADIADRVNRVIGLVDEFAIPVTSSRDESDRAGIVVLEPERRHLTLLTAAMHNHGVSATQRAQTTRLSVHTSAGDETLAMLRAALVSYAGAIR